MYLSGIAILAEMASCKKLYLLKWQVVKISHILGTKIVQKIKIQILSMSMWVQ